MNIEFDAYKQKLNEIHPALMGLADSLNLEGLKNELERLQAMQKLEGQELVEYLGKAAPQEDYLKQTMWWLMRIGSILIGVGIGFLQVIWVRQFPEDGFGNTPEIMLVGGMMLCGALFLIIELFIERKLRK